jgi:hypothetical protein
MLKPISATIATLTLLAGGALAADAPPLAPAKPAGIKHAQDADTMTGIYVIAAGALVAGIVILASDDDDASTPATTTTGT